MKAYIPRNSMSKKTAEPIPTLLLQQKCVLYTSFALNLSSNYFVKHHAYMAHSLTELCVGTCVYQSLKKMGPSLANITN
ncbi:hypothetical protein CCPUN_04920 [Cardinium endosymbiont of Culicoides punctatus]|nr:hypothetical protein CCPUN_04920 [Cardinium endosymbiont of Culicoides punctatus]